VGLIEDIDVDQLSLTVKRTENDLKTVDNQLETMQRMLKYQLGIENDIEVELTDELSSLVDQNIIDQSNYTFKLDENIEYKMLNTQENLQQLSLKREKSLLLPSVSGFYNYNAVLNKTAFTPPQHMVGLSANIAIFQSGIRTSRISQARIEVEKAQNIKEQESQRLILTAQQSKYDYQTALAKFYNEETNFNLSEKVFNNTTQKYKEGLVSSLELSIVNTQFLQAQLSFALAIQELLTSKISLDKAYSKL
jgi:outer membrane protein TolC